MLVGNNKGVDVDGIDIHPKHWQALGAELWKRTVGPLHHPSFVFFFLVAIVGVGPTGVWIEFYDYVTGSIMDAEPLRSSFISFVPAFLAATCMQLIWAEDQRRSLRAFSILVFAICIGGLLLCNNVHVAELWAIAVGFLLVGLAMWMWWVANANQKEFMDDKNQFFTNPIGGDDINAPLTGTLDGFESD